MTVVVLVVVLVSSSLSESLLGAINTRRVLPAYSENTITDLFIPCTVPLFPITVPLFPHLICLMLVRAYYFRNYAGIIRPTLSSSKIKNKPGLKHFPSSYKTQGIYKHSLTGSLLEAVGLYTINALFFFQLFHAHKRAAAAVPG